MIIACPSCETRYRVNESSIPPEGRTTTCRYCDHVWHEMPPGAARPAAVEPPPPSVAVPTAAVPPQSDATETVGSVFATATGLPSTPCGGDREGPIATQWEGEVASAARSVVAPPHPGPLHPQEWRGGDNDTDPAQVAEPVLGNFGAVGARIDTGFDLPVILKSDSGNPLPDDTPPDVTEPTVTLSGTGDDAFELEPVAGDLAEPLTAVPASAQAFVATEETALENSPAAHTPDPAETPSAVAAIELPHDHAPAEPVTPAETDEAFDAEPVASAPLENEAEVDPAQLEPAAPIIAAIAPREFEEGAPDPMAAPSETSVVAPIDCPDDNEPAVPVTLSKTDDDTFDRDADPNEAVESEAPVEAASLEPAEPIILAPVIEPAAPTVVEPAVERAPAESFPDPVAVHPLVSEVEPRSPSPIFVAPPPPDPVSRHIHFATPTAANDRHVVGSHDEGGGHLLAWIGLAATILLILSGIGIFRDSIVSAWPAAGRVYAAIGLPAAAGTGLELSPSVLALAADTGRPTFLVAGTIANKSWGMMSIPKLRVSLLDENQRPLRSIDMDAGKPDLRPGETTTFTLDIENPPSDAARARVIFAGS